MRIVLIGTDRTLFTAGSAVRERLTQLGTKHFESLDSIVFSTRGHGIVADAKLEVRPSSPKIAPPVSELAPTVRAYPTNSRSRLFYGWDALRIARTLKKPDIVSAQDPFETGLAALFISRFYNVPLAVEVHTDFLAPSFAKHSLLNWVRVQIAGYVIKHANGGYAVSEKIRTAIISRYFGSAEKSFVKNFSVLPIYTDISRFSAVTHTHHPKFKTALLWVGRLEKEKNPMLALEVFIKCKKENQEQSIGITFLGDGSLRPILEAKVREESMLSLDLSKYVTFAGFSSDPLPYYTQADLLLVTSEYEGYGMVIVEALAAHVPVLSTDVGIAREAGAIIAEGNYADALSDWLSQKSSDEFSKEPSSKHTSGILRLKTYASEDEYLSSVAKCYEAIVNFAHTTISPTT
jgi:glycosyltransferase involved in cell wall biosynthesis